MMVHADTVMVDGTTFVTARVIACPDVNSIIVNPDLCCSGKAFVTFRALVWTVLLCSVDSVDVSLNL